MVFSARTVTQNGHQIEAKCIYPHCSAEKLACNNTVRARTWLNTTERSPNYGKECIFLHRSVASMVFPARTVSKLRQRMRFPAPFGHLYGVFRPNGHQIEAKCIYPHCAVEKLARQQYRSGKNLAEYNRTVTKLLQKKHFLAPFGRFYGVFRPNG